MRIENIHFIKVFDKIWIIIKHMNKIKQRYTSQDMIYNFRIYSRFMQMGLDDGWGKRDKTENFEIMMQIADYTGIPIQDTTILDVGCGTADLSEFLYRKNIKEYVGIDIFTPAIEKAREKYPNINLIDDDFLIHHFRRKFDYVFCSGALSTNLDTDNYQLITKWIPKMWKLSKYGVVFNFLLENPVTADFLFLYNPEKIVSICESLTPAATVHTITTDAGSGDGMQEMHVFLY